jgi:hypothetical protein
VQTISSTAGDHLQSQGTSDSDLAEGMTRRELLKMGGKVAPVTAVSSVFSPFSIFAAKAAAKSLSFWMFYPPGGTRADLERDNGLRAKLDMRGQKSVCCDELKFRSSTHPSGSTIMLQHIHSLYLTTVYHCRSLGL